MNELMVNYVFKDKNVLATMQAGYFAEEESEGLTIWINNFKSFI